MTASERWTAIANQVEGKSVKECVARYKEIREKLKQRKEWEEQQKQRQHDLQFQPTPQEIMEEERRKFREREAEEKKEKQKQRKKEEKARDKERQRQGEDEDVLEDLFGEEEEEEAEEAEESYEDSEEEEEDEEEEEEEDHEQQQQQEHKHEGGRSTVKIELNPSHRGTRVVLQNLTTQCIPTSSSASTSTSALTSSAISSSASSSDFAGLSSEFADLKFADSNRSNISEGRSGSGNGIGELLVTCQNLRLQVACLRCHAQHDISLAPPSSSSSSSSSTTAHKDEDKNKTKPLEKDCEGCGLRMMMAYRPEICHSHNPSVGYVDLVNASIFDYLPSDYWVTCFECTNDSTMTKVQAAKMTNATCHHCHARLVLGFERVELEVVTPPSFHLTKTRAKPTKQGGGTGTRTVEQRVRNVPIPGIKIGQPLPDNGACKHYRHSYRWFRFPCCGKAFACDVCHENSEGAKHELKWANRLICGLCSTEQPAHNKACKACQHDFSGQSKSHWEGGKGCRDQTKMARNDPRKYKNSKLKTKSKRDTRVGDPKNRPKPGSE